jgi:hypothetical protein
MPKSKIVDWLNESLAEIAVGSIRA